MLLKIESRGVWVEIETDKVPEAIKAQAMVHGLTQKIADSAASALADAGFAGRKFAELAEAEQAAVRELALASMTELRDQLLAGVWSDRKPGAPRADAVTVELRNWLRGKLSDAKRKELKPLDPADRNARLDAGFAKLPAEVQAAARAFAEAEVKRKAKAAEDAKALAGKIEVEI